MPMAADVDTIERTSIVAYTLLNELHEVLALPKAPDDVTLGILMGMAMFLDDKVGPMRAKRLMSEAPTIVLKDGKQVMAGTGPGIEHQRVGAIEELCCKVGHGVGKWRIVPAVKETLPGRNHVRSVGFENRALAGQ